MKPIIISSAETEIKAKLDRGASYVIHLIIEP